MRIKHPAILFFTLSACVLLKGCTLGSQMKNVPIDPRPFIDLRTVPDWDSAQRGRVYEKTPAAHQENLDMLYTASLSLKKKGNLLWQKAFGTKSVQSHTGGK